MADVQIIPVEAGDTKLHREFIRFPHRLYAGNSNWVPFFNADMRSFLRRRHPYYREYPAQFYIAMRDNDVVGTISASYNSNYIKMHNINTAHFFFFETIEDIGVAEALISAACTWAKRQGAAILSGPFMNGGAFGCGALIEGFDKPASMTMMRYNPPYYPRMLETLGFTKFVDLNSYYSTPPYAFDPRVERIVEIIKKRGAYTMSEFNSRQDLIQTAKTLVYDFYNVLLGDHLENYPMTQRELTQLLIDIKLIIRRDLFFLLRHNGTPVGYALGFPDITTAIQKSKGRLTPLAILRLLRAVRSVDRIILNGIGILREHQGRGGSALLYTDVFRGVVSHNPESVEFTQISEHTDILVSDLGKFIDGKSKVHRIFQKNI